MKIYFKNGNPTTHKKYVVKYADGSVGTETWLGSWFDPDGVIVAYAEYTPDRETKVIKQFPHCDQRILHAPGECRFCDEHKDWQDLRIAWNIAFTNEPDPNKIQCPAEQARSIQVINQWHGNVEKE